MNNEHSIYTKASIQFWIECSESAVMNENKLFLIQMRNFEYSTYCDKNHSKNLLLIYHYHLWCWLNHICLFIFYGHSRQFFACLSCLSISFHRFVIRKTNNSSFKNTFTFMNDNIAVHFTDPKRKRGKYMKPERK